ncbi:MAG TPA: hypothetical protein ENF53_04050 [Thermoprotei archaeon]|nr:hypothetical protein [Thermoprotei archaeon]
MILFSLAWGTSHARCQKIANCLSLPFHSIQEGDVLYLAAGTPPRPYFLLEEYGNMNDRSATALQALILIFFMDSFILVKLDQESEKEL